MGIMGRMKVVVVRTAHKFDEDLNGKRDETRDRRFRKPGRIGHHYEAGIDYRSVEYNEKDNVDDLLPDEPAVIEKLQAPAEMKYILTVNFESPQPKV